MRKRRAIPFIFIVVTFLISGCITETGTVTDVETRYRNGQYVTEMELSHGGLTRWVPYHHGCKKGHPYKIDDQKGIIC